MSSAPIAKQPLEADLVINAIEDPDHLQLRKNAVVIKLLKEVGAQAEHHHVLFSSNVTKINAKRKSQARILLITNEAAYNLLPKSYKSKRRINLRSISGITISDEDDDEFVVHVKGEHDYLYQSGRRAEIVHIIASANKNRGLKFNVSVATGKDALRQTISTKKINKRQETIIKQPPQHRSRGGTLTNYLRSLVSKKKKRFLEGGFNLDLTYITDRILAMGYPSEDLEGIYRNPYTEVYRFLELYHSDHYKVYNLCSERKYDSAKFHHRVGYFPFDDHNAPPLRLLMEFCKDVSEWFRQDNRNVVAIHCKAGKGRTGTVIAAYLLYSEMFDTAEDSLHFFGVQRTKNGKGVTIPSQRRYVYYFEEFLRSYYAPKRPFLFIGKSLVLTSVRLNSVPHINRDGGCALYFKIFSMDGSKLYDSRSIHAAKLKKKQTNILIPCNARVSGDFKVQFLDEEPFGSDEKVCHVWLNTNFIENLSEVVLKAQIDKAVKDKKHKKFDQNFRIEFNFSQDQVIVRKRPDEKEINTNGEEDIWDIGRSASQSQIEDPADHRIRELESIRREQDREIQRLRALLEQKSN